MTLRRLLPLAAAAGLSCAVGIRVLQERALVHELAERAVSASDYVARAVTEQGLPWRGYRQGWRDGQAAALRVQLRDVEERP